MAEAWARVRYSSVSQSISQPVSQSASQPISQSANQSVNQSANQSVSQSANQSANRSARQSANQSANQYWSTLAIQLPTVLTVSKMFNYRRTNSEVFGRIVRSGRHQKNETKKLLSSKGFIQPSSSFASYLHIWDLLA